MLLCTPQATTYRMLGRIMGSVFDPFREILRIPGALGFSAAGMLARWPISMLSLGIVVMLSYTSGSYGLAGAVAAVFMIARAVFSPPVARLVDRRGQRRIMTPVVLVHCLALPGLIAAAVAGLPAWVLFGTAIVAGAAVGSVGSLVRARWVSVVQNAAQRHTAFSWEAMIDEVIFMTGPILVTTLGARIHPAAGLVAALVAVAIGSLLFYGQRRTEPAPQPATSGHAGSVLRLTTVLVVVIMFIFAGAGMGSLDVVVVAYAREHGIAGMAGFLLAVLALGSLLAGFVYGSRRWQSGDGPRFLVTVVLLAIMSIGLPASGNIPFLALALFGMGMTVAPTIIGGNAVVQSHAQPEQLTEALTWISTGLGIGISVGSAVAGQAVDRFDARTAFLVVTGFCFAVALVGLLGRKPLTRRPRRVDQPAVTMP